MNSEQMIAEHLDCLHKCKNELIVFVEQVVAMCIAAHNSKQHLYICGNGGSAADATHIVGELVGKLRQNRSPFRATCLGADFATMTAVANDYGYDHIFAREVSAKMLPGDILWCLSTSGNSANIIGAVVEARKIPDVKIVGMSGETGGRLKEWCDACLCVPHTFSDRIQEIHQIAYHLICQGIEEDLLKNANSSVLRVQTK